MLFNSYIFLVVYLPITVVVYFYLARYHNPLSTVWLILMSFLFYATWNPHDILLILSSIAFNYVIVSFINRLDEASRFRLIILIIGITINLIPLLFFKYYYFIISNLSILFKFDFISNSQNLPLGISFFTFIQIAMLVDVYRSTATKLKILPYALFVTYFPHLLAGPIVHHNQLIPQIEDITRRRINWTNVAMGLSLFVLGLTKKVVLGDEFAIYSNDYFDNTNKINNTNLITTWLGVLSFTFQIYFDFSGYSDMAIGISLIFNIILPYNFNSPYKSKDLINFWRNWHITLSNFLKDYLYIPLGGNKKGHLQKYKNLFITMVLGGLWHGANWTFLFWGMLHGIGLIINHMIKQLLGFLNLNNLRAGWLPLFHLQTTILTFVWVMTAWVFFRANNLSDAIAIIENMYGFNPAIETISSEDSSITIFQTLNNYYQMRNISFRRMTAFIILASVIIWFAPNAQSIMFNRNIGIRWSASLIPLTLTIILLAYSFIKLNNTSQFIYFQF